jgi:hypothetical protein
VNEDPVPDADDRPSLDAPLQRLPGRGGRSAVTGGLAILGVLAVLVWQPWSRNVSPTTPVAPAASPVAEADSRSSDPVASAAPSAPGATPAPAAAGVGTYVSLIDNEWTVVAMLDAGAPASTEEPATQHGSAGVGAGPFLVLQQGAHPLTRRVTNAGVTKELCGSQTRPLDRLAVLLPAERVAYLGITFPGMDPNATVSAAGIGRSLPPLRRLRSPSLPLVGLAVGAHYRIPTTGPGGTVLFAPTRGATLASGAYRFEIRAPGIDGPRFVYACVGG